MKKTKPALLLLLLLGVLAGCGGASSTSSEIAHAPAGASGVAPQPGGGAPGYAAAAGSANQADGIVAGNPGPDIERSVTASYTVPPGAFLQSFEAVTARGVQLGGYVVSSQTSPDSQARIVSGQVTLKVPAAKLADFLNGLPAGFSATSINFSSIDHTAQFIDVNARLASAHAHLAALQALLAKATSIDEITNLEAQIETVQTQIDTDQGQLNLLTASVTLATATIQLSERGAVTAPAAVPGPVASGISGGWSNALLVVGAVLEGAVTVLPLAILALVAWLVWRRFRRGHRAPLPPALS